jgi:hypothetical protein
LYGCFHEQEQKGLVTFKFSKIVLNEYACFWHLGQVRGCSTAVRQLTL